MPDAGLDTMASGTGITNGEDYDVNDYEAAARRIRAFVAARDHHRARIDKAEQMMGRDPTNPLPDRIIAEYGHIDINDLRVLLEGPPG